MIVRGELSHLGGLHLFPKNIHAGIGCDLIFVVRRNQSAKKQRNGDHILQTVISVGGDVERSFLVDYAKGGLVRANRDFPDVIGGFSGGAQFPVQGHGRFDRGLRMKFGGKADLEQHILHHIGIVGPLEAKFLPSERDVVKAPGLGRKDG
jgi:hypothetical protein